jgi:hypothetical protein
MARRETPAPPATLVRTVGALVCLVAACSPATPQQTPDPVPATGVRHGPFFPQCGGISDETVAELSKTRGLVNTGRTSAGCQWLVHGTSWPRITFSWYRGSPIGREHKVEQRSRSEVQNVTIDGHDGFLAVQRSMTLGDYLCEIAIGFSDDFIEWSASFNRKPFPHPCDVAEELLRRSVAQSE